MAKILYPVGTLVQVVDNIKVNDNYLRHNIPIGTIAKVIQYREGVEHPYIIEGYSESLNVKELKRYTPKELRSADSVDEIPGQAKVDQGNAVEQPEPTATNKNCGQCSELSNVVSQAIDEIMSRMADVRDIAVQAYEDSEQNRHAIMQIAELTDANFRTVSKQFKSLNHNDN